MPKAEIKLEPNLKVIKPEEIPHLLEPSELGAILELTVTDKNGKITDHRLLKSKSFVRQFLQLLWAQMYPIGLRTEYLLRDTSNVQHNVGIGSYHFASNAGIGVITYGIVAGTGAVAPTINDYALGTIILHDAAPPTPGRMQYGAVTFGAPAADATTSQFTITRNLANASGGAITVNEIGLYVIASAWTNFYYFMTIRDVIAGGILVPNGQTLTINYRPQAVV